MSIAKNYRDDEYYTTKEAAINFIKQVVIPSGILNHKTILMPFSSDSCPLYLEMVKHHQNIKQFSGNMGGWEDVDKYEDVAVVDNPPFSMSTKIEKFYFEHDVPFILFRSAVAYPNFIFEQCNAGIIFENSGKGVEFDWGLGKHIGNDEYIEQNYPNLLDNLKAAGLLRKKIPVGFSFYNVNYSFKVKTITFGEKRYPKKKDIYFYIDKGVFDENTVMYKDPKDGRIHLISN